MNHDHVSVHDRKYRRAGHISWSVGHLVLSWGGVVEHRYRSPPGPNKAPSCGNSFHDPRLIVTYDPMTQEWSELVTSGHIPPPTVAPAGVLSSVDNQLYVYGGMVDSAVDYPHTSNHLYSLDLDTRLWTRLEPSGDNCPSLEKCSGWEYEGDIFIFGGYSDDSSQLDNDLYQVVTDHHSGVDGVWTNCVLRYNVVTNVMSVLLTKGQPPEPRAGAGVCCVGHRVYVFGGRTQYGRLNDLHCLDLVTKTWSLVEEDTDPYMLGWGPPSPTHPSPRSLHTMVRLPDDTMLVYGGIDQLNGVTNDCWLLHVSGADHYWQEVELSYDHGEVRCWHTATLAQHGELVIHSGLTQEYYLTRMDLDNHPENVIHFNFGLQSLTRMAFEAVIKKIETTGHHHSLSILPKPLYKSIMNRLALDMSCPPDKYSPIETEYFRARLHVGV